MISKSKTQPSSRHPNKRRKQIGEPPTKIESRTTKTLTKMMSMVTLMVKMMMMTKEVRTARPRTTRGTSPSGKARRNPSRYSINSTLTIRMQGAAIARPSERKKNGLRPSPPSPKATMRRSD